MHMLPYHTTPVEELHDPVFDQAGVRVLIKREDLNNPLVPGNKWWKLKYNLIEARNKGFNTLLTFGGAYSNHLLATAAAARRLGFSSIGIVRGEEVLPLNRVLQQAREYGMALHYVSRTEYRNKLEPSFVEKLRRQFGDFYLIPEGGTNRLAVRGVAEFAATLPSDFDYLCCAVGTGGTLAGVINGLNGQKKVIGFVVLKGAHNLEDQINSFLDKPHNNWWLNHNWHHGGFAKMPAELTAFIQTFYRQHGFRPDGVYMAKLLRGVYGEIKTGAFKKGSSVLVLHSGGID